MADTLSAEEFVRLQEQLMFLKEQNHDLAEGNRRALAASAAGPAGTPPGGGGAPVASAGAVAAAAQLSSAAGVVGARLGAAPSAAELGQKLSEQFKVGAGAVSALGARGAASFRSTPKEQSEAAEGMLLLAEVAPLREQLRGALEALSAAKKAASTAQQRAAATAAAAAESSGVPPPSVADLRGALGGDTGEAAAPVASLPDALLHSIAAAAVRLDGARRREVAAKREQAPAQSALDPSLGPMLQIQKQQQDLESLREAIDRQSAQMSRLREQAACDKAARPDNQQNLEERLRDTERHLAELSKRIAASEGISSHSYELRCHLQQVSERTQQRDRAIEACLARQDALEHERNSIVERIAFAEEDLLSAEREERTQRRRPSGLGEQGESGEEMKSEEEGGLEEEAKAEAEADAEVPASAGSNSGAPTGGALVDVAIQADLLCGSSGEGAADAGFGSPVAGGRGESLEKLRERVEDLRAEKLALEKRSAQEIKELRALIRAIQTKGSQPGAEEDEKEAEGSNAITSSGSAVDLFSGLLYKQKIQELEALRDGLEQDLELLRESEQLLMQDAVEKEEFIRNLMRSAHSAADSGREPAADAASSGRKGGAAAAGASMLKKLWRAGAKAGGAAAGAASAGAAATGLSGVAPKLGLGRTGRRSSDVDELERIAEEAMLDNMRLRKDLRIIAEEFRKTTLANNPPKEVAR